MERKRHGGGGRRNSGGNIENLTSRRVAARLMDVQEWRAVKSTEEGPKGNLRHEVSTGQNDQRNVESTEYLGENRDRARARRARRYEGQ